MTRRRLRAFRLISAVILPLVALAGLEGLLRLVGVGHDPRFTVPCTVRGVESICDNPKFARRFFPPEIARAAPSFSLPVHKSEDAYRIFVLGGSAAQGDPEPAFGLPRMLRVLLEARYPGVPFEVVNAAITATNSHVARVVAADLSRNAPDLFVVYLGNNEVVGPFGPGSVFSTAPGGLSVVRASVFLRATRLGQSLAALARRLGGTRDSPEWRGMQFFLERRLRSDNPALDRVYDHLRRNLLSIVESSPAPTILGTVASNLADSAPFGSEHRADLTPGERESFDRLFRQGAAAGDAGRTGEALAALEQAERIDGTFAELQFRLGRLLLALDRPDEAYERFARARDLDTLRFRADGRTNEAIREVATRATASRVRLLDAESLVRREAKTGVPGAELFHDHVHLTFHGNFVLARSILDELDELLPNRIRSRGDDGRKLDEAQCAARLAFTDYDRRRIVVSMAQRLQQPPFTGQSDQATRLGALRAVIEGFERDSRPDLLKTSERQYVDAIRADQDDPWLRFNHAVLLGEMGHPERAEAELRSFLARLPQDFQGRERLASTLAEQGGFERSVAECRTLIGRAPHATAPRYTLGYALANLGRLDEALETYRALLRLDPDSWEMLYNEIGRIEIHRGRLEAAITTFEEAIRFNDRGERREIPDIHYNHASALKRSGRQDEARAAFGRAAAGYLRDLDRDPGSVTLIMALGSSLAEAGDLTKAAAQFAEAARLQPTNTAAHVARVQAIAAAGDVEQAIAVGSEAVRSLRSAGRSGDADRIGALLQSLSTP